MVNITETAAVKVKEVLHQQNLDSGYLRVYIAGFG
ncbi:FeS cluster biogenesis [Acididesulfobacillus acetoxydans]|uniref:FeS cluster biogenesis n=2 Tax=Acididesulfobacillus acetoxydans TaxID=1561005 RepID=A0A8S0XBR7_9FIRM|nr:FeS cluster biogenesis [Acididesulfobacillus acetoxydans]CEJ07023.1 FeS cluster biogenesis [Acididesulfobacillus acetoxydans]